MREGYIINMDDKIHELAQQANHNAAVIGQQITVLQTRITAWEDVFASRPLIRLAALLFLLFAPKRLKNLVDQKQIDTIHKIKEVARKHAEQEREKIKVVKPGETNGLVRP